MKQQKYKKKIPKIRGVKFPPCVTCGETTRGFVEIFIQNKEISLCINCYSPFMQRLKDGKIIKDKIYRDYYYYILDCYYPLGDFVMDDEDVNKCIWKCNVECDKLRKQQ